MASTPGKAGAGAGARGAVPRSAAAHPARLGLSLPVAVCVVCARARACARVRACVHVGVRIIIAYIIV